MTKLQYLIAPPRGTAPGSFVERALGPLARDLLAAGPIQLKLTLTTPTPPRLAVIPFSRRQLALLSIWTEEAAAPWSDRLVTACTAAGWTIAGYRVDESVPLAYQRDWPDGQPTPGACLLTLLRRRRGLEDEAFMQRWHGVHSPLSLEIHPLWCYVRNVVREELVAGSPRWDGIVEEHFRHREDLLDPRRFFGGGLQLVPNMARVALDIAGFLDLLSLRTYLAQEHHLR